MAAAHSPTTTFRTMRLHVYTVDELPMPGAPASYGDPGHNDTEECENCGRPGVTLWLGTFCSTACEEAVHPNPFTRQQRHDQGEESCILAAPAAVGGRRTAPTEQKSPSRSRTPPGAPASSSSRSTQITRGDWFRTKKMCKEYTRPPSRGGIFVATISPDMDVENNVATKKQRLNDPA